MYKKPMDYVFHAHHCDISSSGNFRITYFIPKPYNNECSSTEVRTLYNAVSIIFSLAPMLYGGITP